VVNRSVIDAIDFLRPLSDRTKADLAARAVTRRFARGAHLWTAGGEPRGLFVILSGHVRVVRTAGRRQHVVHAEGPGATMGEVPLFTGGTYPATAVAADAVECLVLDRRALVAAMAAHPELAWTLLERLAHRIRHLLDRLSAQTGDPVRARLAAYLLARPCGADGARLLGGTQQQVAEEIGTAREVVVRLLRSLVADGTIRMKRRGSFEVLRVARLKELAAGQ